MWIRHHKTGQHLREATEVVIACDRRGAGPRQELDSFSSPIVASSAMWYVTTGRLAQAGDWLKRLELGPALPGRSSGQPKNGSGPDKAALSLQESLIQATGVILLANCTLSCSGCSLQDYRMGIYRSDRVFAAFLDFFSLRFSFRVFCGTFFSAFALDIRTLTFRIEPRLVIAACSPSRGC